VRVGDLLFVAGQVARSSTGEIVGHGDIRAQATRVMENLATVLDGCGSSLGLVAKITVYTVSLEHKAAITEVEREFFAPFGHYPTSTFLVVQSLADPQYLVEIDAVAGLREPA